MPMTPNQQNKLLKEISKKWKSRQCAMCGNNNWTIADSIFEMREFNGGDLVIGRGNIFPVVPITCSNCGNTHFINPLILGVLERPKNDQDGENNG